MYIADAEFEEHCLNIARVVLDWMLCYFSGTTYDVITFLICIIQKLEYLQNEKRYAKKENAILLYSEKPFKLAASIFYFIGTLRVSFWFFFRNFIPMDRTENSLIWTDSKTRPGS